jgi:hypothetical protein
MKVTKKTLAVQNQAQTLPKNFYVEIDKKAEPKILKS